MIKLFDRAALPAAFALAVLSTGQAAQAKFIPVVPESSSITLLVPGLIVIGGFFAYRLVRERMRRAAKSR